MCYPVVSLLVPLLITADVSGHQSGRDGGVSAPEGQADARGGKEETVAEAICSTSALVGNIPEDLSQNFIELLVENILRGVHFSSDCPDLSFEFFPDVASAVVTFQSGKGTLHTHVISFIKSLFLCDLSVLSITDHIYLQRLLLIKE